MRLGKLQKLRLATWSILRHSGALRLRDKRIRLRVAILQGPKPRRGVIPRMKIGIGGRVWF